LDEKSKLELANSLILSILEARDNPEVVMSLCKVWINVKDLEILEGLVKINQNRVG
jgi:hypothetical protein